MRDKIWSTVSEWALTSSGPKSKPPKKNWNPQRFEGQTSLRLCQIGSTLVTLHALPVTKKRNKDFKRLCSDWAKTNDGTSPFQGKVNNCGVHSYPQKPWGFKPMSLWLTASCVSQLETWIPHRCLSGGCCTAIFKLLLPEVTLGLSFKRMASPLEVSQTHAILSLQLLCGRDVFSVIQLNSFFPSIQSWIHVRFDYCGGWFPGGAALQRCSGAATDTEREWGTYHV